MSALHEADALRPTSTGKGRGVLGWLLVLLPAAFIILNLLWYALQLFARNAPHVAAEANTAFQIGAAMAVVAMLPMGIGAMMIRSAGRDTRSVRLMAGAALVVVPIVHTLLYWVSGVRYYDNPPWSVPQGEVDAFPSSVGLMALVAAIPVGIGLSLIWRAWKARIPSAPREPDSAPQDDGQGSP